MIKIKGPGFQTSSSSDHSLGIMELVSDELLDTSLIPDEQGVLNITGHTEFGWDIEDYYDAGTKALYCYLDIRGSQQLLDMLINVIKKQTGADTVVFNVADNFDQAFPWGYIDHQSAGTSEEAFESEETLRNFIFNTRSWLHTDNDNH